MYIASTSRVTSTVRRKTVVRGKCYVNRKLSSEIVGSTTGRDWNDNRETTDTQIQKTVCKSKALSPKYVFNEGKKKAIQRQISRKADHLR
ncbi:hypothetical protein Trydic_g21656 [Trypoxylus dichotomus]